MLWTWPSQSPRSVLSGPIYFSLMMFTIVCKDLTIFCLVLDCEHTWWDTVKALSFVTEAKTAVFSMVIRLQTGTWLPSCLHRRASLVVMCGHLIKFLQIECRHKWWISLLLLLPVLATVTQCPLCRGWMPKPQRMAEDEGKMLGLQTTRWSRATH